MNTALLTLLSFVLGGGGSDLLDYVSTNLYWQRDETPITLAAMQEVLAPPKQNIDRLIADLGSADGGVRETAGTALMNLGALAIPQLQAAAHDKNPQIADLAKYLIPAAQAQATRQSVRQLLAIRTMGELKAPAALPTLRGLLASHEPFVADYAASAIARIEGKPAAHPADAGTMDDVWLLPANCRTVAQLRPRRFEPIDYQQAGKLVHLARGEDAPSRLAMLSNLALSAAEGLGNVRLAAVSIGLSDDFNLNNGVSIALFSGQFDAGAIGRIAHEAAVAFHTVGGIDVFEPDGESLIFVPAPGLLVLASSPAGQKAIPIDSLVASMSKREPALKRSPGMVELIGQPSANGPMWAAGKLTRSNRLISPLTMLDTFRLVSVEKDATLGLTLTSRLMSGASAADAAKALDTTLAQGKLLLLSASETTPALSEAAAMLRTSHTSATGQNLITTEALNESIDTMFMFPLLVTSSGRPEAQQPR